MLISTLSFSQTIIRVKSGEKIQNIIDDINTPAGSILLLDPGSYEGFTVYKRVSIIGSGYFNGSNSSIITGAVTFSENNNTNSDNSFVTGCNIERVNINRNNIFIQKCRFYSTSSVSQAMSVNIGRVNNCKVSQCFIDVGLYIDDRSTNFVVQNNIILNFIVFGTFFNQMNGKIINNSVGINGSECTPLSFSQRPATNVTISNNIFISPVTCDNRNANNNYQTSQFAKFNNNILRRGNYQSSEVSNKFLTDMTSLFTSTGSSVDAQYLLSTNSQAKGAGEGGTDCGAFGGTEPYIIGGLAIGPVITDLQVPSTARQNETIQIKLKAKVQN